MLLPCSDKGLGVDWKGAGAPSGQQRLQGAWASWKEEICTSGGAVLLEPDRNRGTIQPVLVEASVS